MEEEALQYKMSKKDAEVLAGIVGMNDYGKKVVLKHYFKENGATKLINIFSQFIGLANSVIKNNQEAIETFLIIEKDYHPYQAEKINFPNLFGACQGIILSQGINQDKTCHGCACRIGTLANQSPTTTSDVDYCLSGGAYGEGGDKFYCHEDFDEEGRPTKKCIGFVQIIANRKRQLKKLIKEQPEDRG